MVARQSRTARIPNPRRLLIVEDHPEIDGYQVARRMREEAPEANLTIIALSGYGQAEDHRQSMQAGCDAHLVKPVPPDVLRRRLALEAPILILDLNQPVFKSEQIRGGEERIEDV